MQAISNAVTAVAGETKPAEPKDWLSSDQAETRERDENEKMCANLITGPGRIGTLIDGV